MPHVQRGLCRLLYYSAATELFPVDPVLELEELRRIARVSRLNNQRIGVTGMLLLHQRWFVQVLEGPAADVTATYNRILRDRRHRSATPLGAGPIQARDFEDWAMSAQRVSATDDAIHLTLALKGSFDPARLKAAHALALLKAVARIRAPGDERTTVP